MRLCEAMKQINLLHYSLYTVTKRLSLFSRSMRLFSNIMLFIFGIADDAPYYNDVVVTAGRLRATFCDNIP